MKYVLLAILFLLAAIGLSYLYDKFNMWIIRKTVKEIMEEVRKENQNKEGETK